jgi:hypothetical protein
MPGMGIRLRLSSSASFSRDLKKVAGESCPLLLMFT